MATIGDLLTSSNSATPATVNTIEVDGQTIQGLGSVANPLAAVPNGITNAYLAQIATQTIKGRNTAGTGNVEDLSKAAAQSMLSVDDLVTLSGVSDGAVNLGSFNESIIPDNQTNKQALQALETYLAGLGTITYATVASAYSALNYFKIGYKILTGTPVITGVWTGEGTDPVTLAISCTGGTYEIKSLFLSHNNNTGASASISVTINGVGANKENAVPTLTPFLATQDFDYGSPSGAPSVYFDTISYPHTFYAYSSSGMGSIIFVHNYVSNQLVKWRFLWV